MDYLILKWIHIISATVLFGTGIGSAFYMLMANRSRKLSNIVFATRTVVLADWLFTTPAVIVQLITGIWLVSLSGWSFSDIWIVFAFGLFAFIGACWLPVVWMQIEMSRMAETALRKGKELPDRYWRFERWWFMLGCFAFPATLLIFYLMVFKPG